MLEYLLELRQRLVYVVIFFVAVFACYFYFAIPVYQLAMTPLLKTMASGQKLVATQITSPLLTPLALAGDFSLLTTTPFLLWQIWCFVAPALYQRERKLVRYSIGFSLGLFVLGVFFCYFVVLPFIFQFLLGAVPSSVTMMPDMTTTLAFIMRMLLLFGLSFQIPLVCVLLTEMGILNYAILRKIRPYVIVAAFTLGMLLTPPDVLSQVMLAIPLWLLYECGIFLCYWRQLKSKNNRLLIGA